MTPNMINQVRPLQFPGSVPLLNMQFLTDGFSESRKLNKATMDYKLNILLQKVTPFLAQYLENVLIHFLKIGGSKMLSIN